MQLGNKKTIHILLLEVTVFNCSCLIEGCRGLIVKQPLHDNFFFWPTCLGQLQKIWPTLAFTRQTHVKSQHTPTRNMASVVQWHTRRVAASGLLLFYVFRRRNNKKRWRNRKVWVKPHIARNPSLGVYNTLVQELRAEDKTAFKNFCGW